MSDLLPDLPFRNESSPRAVRQAAKAEESTALAIHTREMLVLYDREVERLENEALAAGCKDALDADLALLQEGMAAAGDDPARREIVARYVSLQNKVGLSRLSRRYGA
jgi:hypothetical protein